MADKPTGTALILFIDQFEELFTSVARDHRHTFIELLDHAAGDPRVRVLTTLRADFLPRCAAEPTLEALLQAGAFVLGPPGPVALVDMIRKPAERAGLDFEDGLIDEILKDGGSDAGMLPLVGFCLSDLYRRTAPVHHLSVDAYRGVRGLRGAIRQHTEELLKAFNNVGGAGPGIALDDVFRVLVQIDHAGKAARQRADLSDLMAKPGPIPRLIQVLISGRLLVTEDVGGRPVVTLAHETLLQEWPALREWLDRNSDRLRVSRFPRRH